MQKRYLFDRIFLSEKQYSKGGISYVFNYTKDLRKNNKILKEGLKKVFNGADVSSLTGAIKEFMDILGKELFSEMVNQIDKVIFDDKKRNQDFESIRFSGKSLITKNGKVKFERRYYKDKETGENVCLVDKVLGLEKGERIDKNVKAEMIKRANKSSYIKRKAKIVRGHQNGVLYILLLSLIVQNFYTGLFFVHHFIVKEVDILYIYIETFLDISYTFGI